MALNQTLDQEQICDLKGNPVHKDVSVLLKSLDKLLTLGAYYSANHEQYILAAEEAAQAIIKAIRPRPLLALEITSEGMKVLDQVIHPGHRNVRQLHELLVPLNIARLEIRATLTATDIRQALEALLSHKLNLGKTHSFQEIVIEDLPPTVQSVSRSVLQNDGSGGVGDTELAGFKEMMEQWHEDFGGVDQDSLRLAQEFMEMVIKILNNQENSEDQQVDLGGGAGNTPVSHIDFEALRLALQRLVEVNPSPQQLLQLLTHARSALDMSRDNEQVDLVFQILRKDILEDTPMMKRSATANPRQINYKLTVDELVGEVKKLDEDARKMGSPDKGASFDHLAICLFLLEADPPEALRLSLLESLEYLFQRPEFSAMELETCLGAVVGALGRGAVGKVDELVGVITKYLRQDNPLLVGHLWFQLKELVQPEDLPSLWPHLVNDLLLGLGQVTPEVSQSVLHWAGSIPVQGAKKQLDKLETMPALQKKSGARDVFKVPLNVMYPVLMVLARTRLSGWLGRGIHASMKARPFSPLIKAIMGACQEYKKTNLKFYLYLISQAQADTLSPKLRLRSANFILDRLNELPRGNRKEKWVPRVLTCLVDLDVEEAGPLLNEVLSAKRFFFFKAWPQASRDAVIQARLKGEE